MPALPEQQARQTIDAMLAAAGWTVQDYKAFDPSVSTALLTATYTPLDKAALRDLVA